MKKIIGLFFVAFILLQSQVRGDEPKTLRQAFDKCRVAEKSCEKNRDCAEKRKLMEPCLKAEISKSNESAVNFLKKRG